VSLSITSASFGPDDDPKVFVDSVGRDGAQLTITAGPRHVTFRGTLLALRLMVVEADRQLTHLNHRREDQSDG
jgi:hypothetical protein